MYKINKFKKDKQRGFSLLEVLLAVTIMITLGSMTIGRWKRETQNEQAGIIGEQIRTVGNGFNAYLAQYYGPITRLESVTAPGTANDPGPRNCDVATRICVISSDTLRRAGLVPPSFSGRNSFGSTYNYYIRVSGTAPHFRVDGVVVTNDPYVVNGTVRHDLIGAAMLKAGADSGTTRTVANQIVGYNGTWLETGYPEVNQLGLLAYRVGYGSQDNSAYYRVDGTLPLTGNMDAGNFDLNNVGNINANGQVTASRFATRVADSNAIILGSDDAANRTAIGNSGNRLRITNAGGVEVMNAAGQFMPLVAGNVTSSGNLNVTGDGVVAGIFNANELSVNQDASIGRNLGVTGDVIAGGFISENGSFVTQNGNVSAPNGSITSRTLNISDTATFGGNVTVLGRLTVNNELYIGASGLTFNNGTSTLSTIGNTNFQANDITANGYLRTLSNATANSSCAQRGQIALDVTAGTVVSCNGTRWVAGSISNTYSRTGGTGTISDAVCDTGDRVTGCTAAYISRGTVSDPSNAAQIEVINSNTCRVRSPNPPAGGSGITLQAVAVCAR